MGNSPSGIDPPSPSPRGEKFPIPVPAKVVGGHLLPSPFPAGNWYPAGIPVPDTKQDKSNGGLEQWSSSSVYGGSAMQRRRRSMETRWRAALRAAASWTCTAQRPHRRSRGHGVTGGAASPHCAPPLPAVVVGLRCLDSGSGRDQGAWEW